MSVPGVAVSPVSAPLRKISTAGCHEVELLGRVGISSSSDLHASVIKCISLKTTPSFILSISCFVAAAHVVSAGRWTRRNAEVAASAAQACRRRRGGRKRPSGSEECTRREQVEGGQKRPLTAAVVSSVPPGKGTVCLCACV